jgi:Raf kinase inhibitor-like YbhB/YbcL family protein
MKIKSRAFDNQGTIPKKYSCEGDNINPPLEISGIPAKAKTLAIIVCDPDAPNGDFVHWLLWNIDPKTEVIEEGTAPVTAIEGINDAGHNDFLGPCPPSGMHRYEFHIYALDDVLDLPEISNKDALREQIKGHIIEEAQVTGLYSKG